jgi:hypothetical protein
MFTKSPRSKRKPTLAKNALLVLMHLLSLFLIKKVVCIFLMQRLGLSHFNFLSLYLQIDYKKKLKIDFKILTNLGKNIRMYIYIFYVRTHSFVKNRHFS